MSDKYIHTITLNADSTFFRIFHWLWGISSSDLNTCLLFWGCVFSPFALVGKFLIWLLTPLFLIIKARLPEPSNETPRARTLRLAREAGERKAAKEAKGPGGFQRALERIAAAADKGLGFYQKHGTPVTKTVSALLVVLRTICVLIAYALVVVIPVGLVGLFVYACIHFGSTVLSILGLVAAAAAVILFIVFTISYLDRKQYLKRLGHAILDLLNKIKGNLKGVGNIIAVAFDAVHYRTCAKVDVQGAPPEIKAGEPVAS